ncbi:MAG: c-type cytochrome biogenesis protein CcmI [Hyphomicrobiaceae bacterium]
MLIWIGCAVLTAVVVAVIARPLMQEGSGATSIDSQVADLAVYRDQLSEIDGDQARGLIEDVEAEAAKAELARRILRRAETIPKTSKQQNSKSDMAASGDGHPSVTTTHRVAVVLALFVPLASVAGYVLLGAPHLPSQPYASRINKQPAKANVAELVGQVEARLRSHPNDGTGWDVIAPIYLKQRRFDEASQAYANAIRLLGETPRRLQGLGQARVMANDGQVDQIARTAFEKILKKQPDHVEAQFWLAAVKEQEGDLNGAIAAYKNLLASGDRNAPWRQVVEQRLSRALSKAGMKPDANASAAQKPEAEATTAQDRSNVNAKAFPNGVPPQIVAMVEGLAKKLEADGNNLEGWMQLIKSYHVIGRKGDAKAAANDAKKFFPGGTTEAKKIDDLLVELDAND